jgi:hypothetical protein
MERASAPITAASESYESRGGGAGDVLCYGAQFAVSRNLAVIGDTVAL